MLIKSFGIAMGQQEYRSMYENSINGVLNHLRVRAETNVFEFIESFITQFLDVYKKENLKELLDAELFRHAHEEGMKYPSEFKTFDVIREDNYLTGVIEYLTFDLLEMASMELKSGKTQIQIENIQTAIEEDTSMKAMFSRLRR